MILVEYDEVKIVINKGIILTVILMTTGLLQGCSSTTAEISEAVAAEVNGQPITVEQVEKKFTQKYTVNGLDSADPQMSRIKKATVEELINEQLLLQEANNREIGRAHV